ncbi:MAG: toprim domain-containing protein [Candidatus Woesearchaeota archaeon]
METILEWIYCLKIEKSKIIVEGLKDKKALKSCGVKNLVVLKGPLYKFVEDLSSEREVIILTDTDYEGRKLYRRLKRDFEMFGVRVNYEYRNFIIKNTNLRNIEGIKKLIKSYHSKGKINKLLVKNKHYGQLSRA